MKNVWKNILLIILVLGAILLNVFLVYENSKLDEEEEIEVEDLKNANYFLDLIDEYNLNYLDNLNKDVDNPKNLSNQEKLRLVFADVEQDVVMTNEEVNTFIKTIFGSTATIGHEDVKDNDEVIFKYDSETKEYTYNEDYKKETIEEITTIVNTTNSFENSNNRYTIQVVKLFKNSSSDKVYYGTFEDAQNKENAIVTYDKDNNNINDRTVSSNLTLEENLKDYYNNNYQTFLSGLTKYTYTFFKEEENYILTSYEIIEAN